MAEIYEAIAFGFRRPTLKSLIVPESKGSPVDTS